MSDLIAIAYDDEFKAEEVRLTLAKLQREHLIEMEDAAVVVKNAEGKVKLKQAVDLTSAGAVSGGFWGLLIGTLFLNPLLGTAVGAAGSRSRGVPAASSQAESLMSSLWWTTDRSSSSEFITDTVKGFERRSGEDGIGLGEKGERLFPGPSWLHLRSKAALLSRGSTPASHLLES